MDFPATADSLAAFASAFVQSDRLLKLHFASGSGIRDDLLLPWKLAGQEGINTGFRFELTALSSDAMLPLKSFIGQPVAVTILTDTGEDRPITGWVSAAREDGSDGGMSRYVLTIEDLFAVLALRINNRVFQDLDAKEAFLKIIQEHRGNNAILAASLDIDDRTRRDYPRQSWITQYNESDAAFGKRRLAEEGINFFFAHKFTEEQPIVSLVLFDDNAQLENAVADQVRFHRADGTEASDTITTWNSGRTLVPSTINAASFDYKTVSLAQVNAASRFDQGEAGDTLAATLEDYRHDINHYGNEPDDYQRYAGLRCQAQAFAAKQFSGESTVRAFTVGSRFTLTDHPEIDQHDALDRAFILTRIEIEAANNLEGNRPVNLSTDASQNAATYNSQVYTNRFAASRDTIRIVPPYRDGELAAPTAPQRLTGIVVGPVQEEIHTDQLGRVKVNLQFPRSQDHPDAGANWNENDSPWLRVSQAWTGGEYGALFLPRVGDEVNVGFIGGDIDRPIVLGHVYNGTHRPPTFSHAGDLPGNKALSGVKSKMYKGAGANELILDDSSAEQRTRLATDHGQTALNQGYLVHPRVDGKGQARGEGFELRSDLAGAIRAAQGLLLSTDGRSRASGNQLDRQELIGQLEVALAQVKQLSELAQTHQAEDTDHKPQAHLLEHIQHWEAGSNTAATNGKGKQAVLAVSGQAGIALATPNASSVQAGTNLDAASKQDSSINSGRNFKVRATNLISLFAYKLGMKLMAAGGKIQIEAHAGNIEITAAKKVMLTGLEEVNFKAPKISLISQGAGFVFASNSITSKTAGTHTRHAADHVVTGPAGVDMVLPKMPHSVHKGLYPFSL